MGNHERDANTELWECGELGRSLEHSQVAPEASEELDEVLGLQMISIRLEKRLIRDLKEIAKYHGVGYQPMMRDLLNRFATSEIRSILIKEKSNIQERIEQLQEEGVETTTPVDEFVNQLRKQA